MFQTFELIFFLRPQTELKSEASKQVKSPPSHQPPPPPKKKKIEWTIYRTKEWRNGDNKSSWQLTGMPKLQEIFTKVVNSVSPLTRDSQFAIILLAEQVGA